MVRPNLYKRIYKYIQVVNRKNPEQWVWRKTIFENARRSGYTKGEAFGALNKLEEQLNIGKIYDNGQVMYRYYPMSPQEIQRRKKIFSEFEKMPDGHNSLAQLT